LPGLQRWKVGDERRSLLGWLHSVQSGDPFLEFTHAEPTSGSVLGEYVCEAFSISVA
jgi:hypothetical protein